MALTTQDYILKIYNKENRKNNPIKLDREIITQIKNNATTNSTDRKSEPLPVNFSISTSIAPTGSIAKLRFNVVSKDIFENSIRVIAYEIYRSEASDETELSSENISLIASIDSSRIQGDAYTFEDKTAISSVYYYAIVAVDSNGRTSEPSFQKYNGDYGFINDITFSSYNILADKSIDLNFSINYVTDGTIPAQLTDEYNDFIDFLDFIEFRNGTDWDSGDTILKTKQLSYNFKPTVLSDTYYIKAKHLFGNYSENALSLSIGSGQTVDWTIGTLDVSSSLATEDFYTSKDGTVNSRIKLNLSSIGGDSPSKILVKIRKSGEATFNNAVEIDYDTTIYLENGAESLEIGKEYFIEVYPKTEWGLLGTKIDLSVTLSGKNIPPTPVFFTDDTGTPITSKTFEREFDLTWEFSVDADDDTYELRYGNTSSTWETAAFLWQGRAEKYIWQPDGSVLTSNVVRVWIKSRNRSGLYQTNASYIDCTNNAPSTPNAPSVQNNSSGMIVSWIEKTTASDKDISYYKVFINEDGVELADYIKSNVLSITYNPNAGMEYKFRIKAVDIYGQESSYSSYSNLNLANLNINAYDITIYPSGDRTIDTVSFNNAFLYLSANSDGRILLLPQTYYLDLNTLSCSSSKKISIISELGIAILSITGTEENIFSVGGGNFSGIQLNYESGSFSGTYNINGFDYVYNSVFDNLSVQLFGANAKIEKCSGIYNARAHEIRTCTINNDIICNYIFDSTFSSGIARKVCDSCTFDGLQQYTSGAGTKKIGEAKLKDCVWTCVADIYQSSNSVIDNLNAEVSNSTLARTIIQKAFSKIINSSIKYGVYDSINDAWTNTYLTITQDAFSSISDSSIVGNIQQPVSLTQDGWSGVPPIDYSPYLECNSKISNISTLYGYTIQGTPDSIYTALRFDNYLSGSYINGNATTYGTYYWSNNNVTGTITHNA